MNANCVELFTLIAIGGGEIDNFLFRISIAISDDAVWRNLLLERNTNHPMVCVKAAKELTTRKLERKTENIRM